MKFLPGVHLVLLLFFSDVVVFPQASTLSQGKVTEQPRSATSPASQAHADDVAAIYQLGVTALKQRKPTEALKCFERVHALRPTDIPPLTRMLECQLVLKRRSAARQTTQKLRALLKPQDPSLFEAASLLAQYGDYTAAIPIMEQARVAFPESYDVSYNLALAYFRSRQHVNAAQTLQALLKQQPRAEAYDLLAMVEEHQGHYLEAVRSFQKAAELEPSNEGFRFDYAFELLKHRTDEAAIAIFASGVRDFPKSAIMRLGLGSAYYLVRKYEEAAQVVLEAIKIEPTIKFAYFLLGKIYEWVDVSQAAIREALSSYLEKGPDDAWAYYHYASILYQQVQHDPQADYQPARNNLNKALALNPGLAEAHMQLGMILQKEGQDKASLPYLERAIQSNPKLDVAHYRLGLAYSRLGQKEKAMDEFDLFEKLKSQDQKEWARQKILQFLVKQ